MHPLRILSDPEADRVAHVQVPVLVQRRREWDQVLPGQVHGVLGLVTSQVPGVEEGAELLEKRVLVADQ